MRVRGARTHPLLESWSVPAVGAGRLQRVLGGFPAHLAVDEEREEIDPAHVLDLSSRNVRLCAPCPAKFYIVQPALQRLAGRARPGALVVGRELAQVVP